MVLEIPVFTLEAALQAADFGADRLELCSGISAGGLTPSPGALNYIKSKVTIPVFVMIRPRGGGFIYSDQEISVMQEDIKIMKSLGADGFVFGALTSAGAVDKSKCQKLVKSADGLPCTFHRAFDVSKNLFSSLEDVIDGGFQRILTSGGRNSVSEGLENINSLLEAAEKKIIVMPGGGMKPQLISSLAEKGFLHEIHASCKTWRSSTSTYRNKNVHLETNHQYSAAVPAVDKSWLKVFSGK